VAGSAGADLAAGSGRNDSAADASASDAGTPGLSRGRFVPRERTGGFPSPPIVGRAEAPPSASTDVPPGVACGDCVIAVFIAATAAAMQTREGLSGDLSGAVDERLPLGAVIGVVVGVCSWKTAAATSAVTRVAIAGVPLLSVAYIEDRVHGTADCWTGMLVAHSTGGSRMDDGR